MSLNKAFSLEEHCCLADLGIRFSTLAFGICTSAGNGGDGDGGADSDAAAGIAGMGDGVDDTGSGTGSLGGLPDPGHLAVTGPWILSRPPAVMETDLKQTAHMLGAITKTKRCWLVGATRNIWQTFA